MDVPEKKGYTFLMTQPVISAHGFWMHENLFESFWWKVPGDKVYP